MWKLGLVSMLKDVKEFVVAEELFDENDVFNAINKINPDVLLLNIMLPCMNGHAVLKKLVRKKPALKCIVVAQQHEELLVKQVMYEGAHGLISKDADTVEILTAIQEVISIGSYFKNSSGKRIGINYRLKKETDNIFFSDRGNKILQLLSDGLSSEEIGRKLFISRRTVEDYRQQMMENAEVHNATALVKFAVKNGLVT